MTSTDAAAQGHRRAAELLSLLPDDEEAATHKPKIVLVDENNRLKG